MSEYFVYSITDDDVLGPYTIADLALFIEPGVLIYDDKVGNWNYSEDIPEIKDLLQVLGIYIPENNDDLPDGFYVNEFGEINRQQTPNRTVETGTNRTVETANSPNPRVNIPPSNPPQREEKDYTGWIILAIIAIIIILINLFN
jgi:hypothetical protein